MESAKTKVKKLPNITRIIIRITAILIIIYSLMCLMLGSMAQDKTFMDHLMYLLTLCFLVSGFGVLFLQKWAIFSVMVLPGFVFVSILYDFVETYRHDVAYFLKLDWLAIFPIVIGLFFFIPKIKEEFK